jgi:hypothetical protein
MQRKRLKIKTLKRLRERGQKSEYMFIIVLAMQNKGIRIVE